jgi:2,3,4,5-tetrahydropyridine-2-carboxylate N-succinyltransferase
MNNEQKIIIEQAWEDRNLLSDNNTQEAIRSIIEDLDKGKIRVSEKINDNWQVNEWVKKAVILYFPIQKMETLEAGPLEFHDKMKLKTNYS